MRAAFLSRRAGTYLMRLLPMTVYGRIVPREVIGLCYHVVSDRRLPHVRHLYPYKSVEQFEADLLYLKRRFRVVSYPEIVEAGESGRGLGPGAVHLSFDDGYAECFSVVRPILLKHGVPCTFFVTTDALDNRWMIAFNRVSLCIETMAGLGTGELAAVLREVERDAGTPLPDASAFGAWIRSAIRAPDSGAEEVLDRVCARLGVDVAGFLHRERPYLTVEEVRQLASEGFTVGGHTRTHPRLGSTTGTQRIESEIVESCRVVAEITGAERVPFAFPYDAVGVDRGFLRDLLGRHPQIGRLFGTGAFRPDEDFMVNRMLVDSPPAVGRGRTNLPGLLSGAYLEEMMLLARGHRGAVEPAAAT
ncbi:MAG TPA: polysaccharide deacetylase family protein [Longimicrobiaceae bacterium]|nr:polysaccharide deacetylase family protein [Longimicrobiaceae bacterium]